MPESARCVPRRQPLWLRDSIRKDHGLRQLTGPALIMSAPGLHLRQAGGGRSAHLGLGICLGSLQRGNRGCAAQAAQRLRGGLAHHGRLVPGQPASNSGDRLPIAQVGQAKQRGRPHLSRAVAERIQQRIQAGCAAKASQPARGAASLSHVVAVQPLDPERSIQVDLGAKARRVEWVKAGPQTAWRSAPGRQPRGRDQPAPGRW